jgi:hypothetical protein
MVYEDGGLSNLQSSQVPAGRSRLLRQPALPRPRIASIPRLPATGGPGDKRNLALQSIHERRQRLPIQIT